MTPESRLEPLLDEAARRIAARIDPLAKRVAWHILTKVPELREIEGSERWLGQAAGVRANLEAVLSVMPHGIGAQKIEPPAVTQERVRRLVRAKMPLSPLLRSYRWGHAHVWEAWQAEILRLDADAETRSRLLAYSSEVLFTFIDRVSESLGELYARERESWVKTAAAVRVGVVRDLLAGEAVEETVAGARLHYDLRRSHIAFVIWAENADRPADMNLLEDAATTLADRLGQGAPLTVPASETAIIGWCGKYGELEPSSLDAACQIGLGPDLRLALGEPGYGIPGFRRSHREATVTKAVMRQDGDGATSRRYCHVALASLLVADAHRASEFAKSTLGPLARDNRTMLSLRITLGVLLEEGGSKVSTARRLKVHKNTVSNRLSKIEDLLGRPIEARRHELEAALLIEKTLRNSPERINVAGRNEVPIGLPSGRGRAVPDDGEANLSVVNGFALV